MFHHLSCAVSHGVGLYSQNPEKLRVNLRILTQMSSLGIGIALVPWRVIAKARPREPAVICAMWQRNDRPLSLFIKALPPGLSSSYCLRQVGICTEAADVEAKSSPPGTESRVRTAPVITSRDGGNKVLLGRGYQQFARLISRLQCCIAPRIRGDGF